MFKGLFNLFGKGENKSQSPADDATVFTCTCGKVLKMPTNRHIIFKCPYCQEGYTAKYGVLVDEGNNSRGRESKSNEIKRQIMASLNRIEFLLKELHTVEPFTRNENEVLARMATENNSLFKMLLGFQENHPNDLGIAYHSYGCLRTISDKQAKVEVLMTFIFSALYKLQRESSFSLFEDYNHEMFTQKLLNINGQLVKEWLH